MVEMTSHSSNVVSLVSKTQPAGLARMPDTIRRCQDKARLLLQPLVARMLDKVDDALFELADKAVSNVEQNLYFDAMRQVRVGRRALEQSMTLSIQQAFVDLYEPKTLDKVTTDIDTLSLVANDDLEELVAVDAMVNKASEASAEAIQHLTMRLDNQLDVKVYQGNNPFSPRVICSGFVDAAKKLSIDLKAKLVLFKYFDQQVARELAGVYSALNDLLIDGNVLPSLTHDLKQMRQSSSASRAVAANNSARVGDSASNLGSDPATEVSHQTRGSDLADALPELRGVLSSLSSDTGTTPNTNQLTELLSQLQGASSAPSLSQDPHGVVKTNLRQAIDQSIQNTGQTVRPIENDLINLVSMLFEFILEDRSLAPAMKSVLSRLQIPFLKLALMDHQFFSRSGHPARRLLNEMATAALGWQAPEPQLNAKPDRLYRKIFEIVEQVVQTFETDTNIFSELLEDFLSFSDKEKRRAKVLEQRMLDAEQGKAKSEQAREQVDVVLSPILNDPNLPEVARQLVEKAWSNVLMMAKLKNAEQPVWLGHIQTAKDLAWSVCAPLDQEGRGKLIGLLPDLLSRLRKGLEGIAYNPYEMSQLFEQLEKVHLDRLRAPIKEPSVVVTSSLASEEIESVPEELLEPAIVADMDEAASDSPDMPAESEVRDVNNLVESSGAESKVTVPQTLGMELDLEQSPVNTGVELAPFLAQVDRLAQGSWFEMDTEGQNYRCRLAAIIKGADKFVFINRAGAKVAQKTREELAWAFRSGELKILDDSMLFDRALENVIGSLRSQRGF